MTAPAADVQRQAVAGDVQREPAAVGWSDSFEQFAMLPDALIAAGFEYRLLVSNGVVVDRGALMDGFKTSQIAASRASRMQSEPPNAYDAQLRVSLFQLRGAGRMVHKSTDALPSNWVLMELFSISEFPPGAVRCVLGERNSASLGEMVSRAADGVRLVTCWCSTLDTLEAMLDHHVSTIAEAALLVWPDWYGGEMPLDKDAAPSDRSLVDRFTTRQMLRSRCGINGAWLPAAMHACRAGRAPLLKRFPLDLQAEQLSLALADRDLILAVEVDDAAPSSSSLLNLSRGLEWLARETDARVVAFLPESLAARAELDGITAGALRLAIEASSQTIDEAEERKHLVCPIIGRPHPASPGEQKLAARLALDEQLASLFRFNERVTTTFGSRFLVDLIWPEGRVAVEIDGYGYHSSPAAFRADRHRDYELTLTGYLVLRLPHDSVVADVDLAVEHIREFVNFRTKHPFLPTEIPA